jgi:hypothetical protein
MKNRLFIVTGILSMVLVFGMAFVMASCDSLLNKDGGNDDDKLTDNTEVATVKINLPLMDGRNIATAASDTNFYEVIMYKHGDGSNYATSYNASTTSKERFIQLLITPGVYDVLMLAGNFTDSEELPDSFTFPDENFKDAGLPVPILLASGYVENKEIKLGNNTVDITLNSIDCAVNIPESVDIGHSFDVSVTVSLRNEFLWKRWAAGKNGGVSCHLYTTAETAPFLHFWDYMEDIYQSDIIIKPEDYVAPTAPTTPGTYSIVGACYLQTINLAAEDILKQDTNYFVGSKYIWYLFNSYNTTYTGKMPTEITFAETGHLDMNVKWGSE